MRKPETVSMTLVWQVGSPTQNQIIPTVLCLSAQTQAQAETVPITRTPRLTSWLTMPL